MLTLDSLACAVESGAWFRRPDSVQGVNRDLSLGVLGSATAGRARRAEGDALFFRAPVGNGFTPPPGGAPPLLVGGGVEIPPMLYLAEKLAGSPAVAFCGAL